MTGTPSAAQAGGVFHGRLRDGRPSLFQGECYALSKWNLGELVQMLRFVVALILVLGAKIPAHAQKQLGVDDLLAGVVMRSGFLCSRVVEKRELPGSQMEVTCIEYFSGTNRVRYIIDLSTNKASKAPVANP
jgi:hypothetical protein